MRVAAELERLTGDWQGTNLLWLSEEPIVSETTAAVKSVAGGTCLCVEYAWRYEGEAQEGILLMGSRGKDAVQGIWRDAWHSGGEFLISDGKAEGPGDMQVLGHYAAPSGPDWGWKNAPARGWGRSLRDRNDKHLSRRRGNSRCTDGVQSRGASCRRFGLKALCSPSRQLRRRVCGLVRGQ